MSNYIDYMHKMSQSDLRAFLGQNMVDLIVEWWPEGDAMLTKQRMVSMIDSLYGTSILKEKNFRRSLLLCMQESDIYQIRDDCLKGAEKQEEDPLQIVESVVNKPWKNNHISVYLAYLWGLTEAIFDKEKDDAVIENDISAPEEQFYELLDYQYYIKQRALANLNSGHPMERMLVHMPTGTGKTKTSMHTITNYINFTLSISSLRSVLINK